MWGVGRGCLGRWCRMLRRIWWRGLRLKGRMVLWLRGLVGRGKMGGRLGRGRIGVGSWT